MQRGSHCTKISDASVKNCKPQEPLNLFAVDRIGPFQDSTNLSWIHLNSPLRNNEPQERHGHVKLTLLGFDEELVVKEALDNSELKMEATLNQESTAVTGITRKLLRPGEVWRQGRSWRE